MPKKKKNPAACNPVENWKKKKTWATRRRAREKKDKRKMPDRDEF